MLPLLLTVGVCAPDAWQNTRATSFNAYLGTVETRCQPLWFGRMQLDRFDAASAGAHETEFAALLNNASRMYYGRITPEQFRDSVNATTVATTDARTNRTVDCMIAELPADRPTSPAGR